MSISIYNVKARFIPEPFFFYGKRRTQLLHRWTDNLASFVRVQGIYIKIIVRNWYMTLVILLVYGYRTVFKSFFTHQHPQCELLGVLLRRNYFLVSPHEGPTSMSTLLGTLNGTALSIIDATIFIFFLAV